MVLLNHASSTESPNMFLSCERVRRLQEMRTDVMERGAVLLCLLPFTDEVEDFPLAWSYVSHFKKGSFTR